MGSAVFPVAVRNACAWMQTAIEALAETLCLAVRGDSPHERRSQRRGFQPVVTSRTPEPPPAAARDLV